MINFFGIKLVIFILIFSIFLDISKSFCATIKKNEFSIVIPDNWTDIPKNIIDAQFKSANEIFNEKFAGFDYGFQSKKSKSWFEFPYILIQINNKNRLTLSDWKKIDKYSFNKINNKIVSSGFIKEFAWEDISKRIWMLMSFNLEKIGEVTCISGIIPTNAGYIQIYIYDLKNDYNINESSYIDYILSVKPDISYVYKSNIIDELPQSIQSINWSFLAENSFGGIPILVLVAYYFYIRNSYKKKAFIKNKDIKLDANLNDKKQNFTKKDSLDNKSGKDKVFIKNNDAITNESYMETNSPIGKADDFLKLVKNELLTRFEERYSLVSQVDEQLYEKTILEIETDKCRLGLWAKCFSESEGNEAVAKALYIKKRYDQFFTEKLDQEKKLTKDSADWLKLTLLISCPRCQSICKREKCLVLDIVDNKIEFIKTPIKCDLCNFYFQIPNNLDSEFNQSSQKR